MAEVISFRLNDEHRSKLVSLAKAWNCSHSDVIRRLLESAKVADVPGINDEGDSDVKQDRASMIRRLQRLHTEALRKQAEGRKS